MNQLSGGNARILSQCGQFRDIDSVWYMSKLSRMAIFDNRPRKSATQSEILLSYAERLRTIPTLNTQNVVVSDQVVPAIMPGGGLYITVSPGEGRFGGDLEYTYEQALENGSLIIGIFRRSNLDRPGRAEAAIIPSGSLLDWKRKVLRALSVDEEWLGGKVTWEPRRLVDDRFVPLCRNQPKPTRVTQPSDVMDHPGWLGIQITFAVEWDWDLSGND